MTKDLKILTDKIIDFTSTWLHIRQFNYKIANYSVLYYGSFGQTIPVLKEFNENSDIDCQVFVTTSEKIKKNQGTTQRPIRAHKYGLIPIINNLPRHLDVMITCKEEPFDDIGWLEKNVINLKTSI